MPCQRRCSLHTPLSFTASLHELAMRQRPETPETIRFLTRLHPMVSTFQATLILAEACSRSSYGPCQSSPRRAFQVQEQQRALSFSSGRFHRSRRTCQACNLSWHQLYMTFRGRLQSMQASLQSHGAGYAYGGFLPNAVFDLSICGIRARLIVGGVYNCRHRHC